MNKEVVLRILFFVVLVLMQVLVFSNMRIGAYVPFVYVLFILIFPIKSNQSVFLFSSFLLGLSLDFFYSSGGVHAAACTLIAYIRPQALKFSFGRSYEFQTIKFSKVSPTARIAYFSILIVIHHLVLFLLETFNVSFILYSLKSTLFSSIYTLLLCLFLVKLFSKRKE